MKREILFLRRADDHVQRAYEFFENNQPGTGDLFLERPELTLDLLTLHPLIGPPYNSFVRRLLIAKTTFAIFYAPQGNRLIIHGVLDLRSHPRTIETDLNR